MSVCLSEFEPFTGPLPSLELKSKGSKHSKRARQQIALGAGASGAAREAALPGLRTHRIERWSKPNGSKRKKARMTSTMLCEIPKMGGGPFFAWPTASWRNSFFSENVFVLPVFPAGPCGGFTPSEEVFPFPRQGAAAAGACVQGGAAAPRRGWGASCRTGIQFRQSSPRREACFGGCMFQC